MILKDRKQNKRITFKVNFIIFLVSQNYKFIVWTDASSIERNGIEETTTGFVIKDGYFPPLIDSDVHLGIGNSKGELQAGIESLRTLIDYCKCFDIDTRNAVVELKTDFPELRRALGCNLVKCNNLEKLRLLKELAIMLNT